ncbi:hypothetical protein BRADI_1g26161v3 [Brachypodium distachyon]|uniref:RNase H type-1 domain-containing protein n=1 Tax=Brachypodium distachyon TaxID=15368 RepID=A0A2K2DL48_BRADI|nr:hypothetical protein BRADI_1g26161v3 [Brachypodium distachyon]
MSFRDLRIFNQALLAKQAWRLLMFPDSLCARLLKARYYPHGKLTDTAFIQNTSLGWQGIMHGLELFKKGIIWRIRSGSQVQIWRDNWIPRAPESKRVEDLINQDNNTWNTQLVQSVFHAFDAQEILKIKLLPAGNDDFIAWHYEKSGIFTVRSAYRLGLNLKQNLTSTGASGCPDSGRKLWDNIWEAPVPPKIRVHRRAMDLLPTCSICGMAPEDGYHAVMVCTKAKALRDSVLNVDASFLESNNSATWGVVIRDHSGKALVSARNIITDCPSAEAAEAFACLEGVKILRTVSDRPAIVETDCLAVSLAINSSTKDRSVNCGIYEDIKLIKLFDPGIQVRKINRSCNAVAHGIASWCHSVCRVMRDCTPNSIIS